MFHALLEIIRNYPVYEFDGFNFIDQLEIQIIRTKGSLSIYFPTLENIKKHVRGIIEYSISRIPDYQSRVVCVSG